MQNEKYLALRRRHAVFEYTGYHWNTDEAGLRLCFDFRMGDVEFHPTALVERRPFLDFGDSAAIDRTVFEIGMVELVSYWKCACPPVVSVLCAPDDGVDTAFWRKLYWNGLGEFFYTNAIEATEDDFMDLRLTAAVGREGHESAVCGRQRREGYLVPIGGGKDSVVTLELLRKAGCPVRPLIMNPRGATTWCAEAAGFPLDEVLVIRRTIDPTLLELNRQGYLNGHTPFSAMLAFYTMLASVLSGVANVALSNESSANESTVPGSTVNHQYSKCLEFEDDFRRYAERLLPEGRFRYFSFLRPLSELQIAMLFSRQTAYHDIFRSCNVGSKQDIWCGHCAKCLFAYIILSPFIEPARLDAIFGKSMLADLALRHEMMQLCGMAETKPFECVGTVGEVRQALAMTLNRWYGENPPALLKEVVPCLGVERVTVHQNLAIISPIGNLNTEERTILQQACIEKNS